LLSLCLSVCLSLSARGDASVVSATLLELELVVNNEPQQLVTVLRRIYACAVPHI
jgi:hypothetical protein